VPLESSEKCLIGNIQKVIMTSKYCFILSGNSVYQFLRSGKFVRAIGNIGRGPKEFLDIFDFAVNEKEEKIYIADCQKILQFNFNGEFCSSSPGNILWKFEVTDNDRFIINPINVLGNEANKLIVKNQAGDTLKKFKNSILFEPKIFSLWPQLKSIFRVEDDFIFHQQFCDTIFTLNPGELTLTYRYSFDFGNAGITNKALSEGQKAVDDATYITDVTEDLRFIYVICIDRGNSMKYVIEKSTGKYYIADFYIKEAKFNFWPEWQYQDSLLIDIIYTSCITRLKDSLPVSYLNSFLKNIDDNSNPILIIVNSNN
jgi:hypothetical protein